MDEPLEKAWKLHLCMEKVHFCSDAQIAMLKQTRFSSDRPSARSVHASTAQRKSQKPLTLPLLDLLAANFEVHGVFAGETRPPDPTFLLKKICQ